MSNLKSSSLPMIKVEVEDKQKFKVGLMARGFGMTSTIKAFIKKFNSSPDETCLFLELNKS